MESDTVTMITRIKQALGGLRPWYRQKAWTRVDRELYHRIDHVHEDAVDVRLVRVDVYKNKDSGEIRRRAARTMEVGTWWGEPGLVRWNEVKFARHNGETTPLSEVELYD